jgi:hypothetical protein
MPSRFLFLALLVLSCTDDSSGLGDGSTDARADSAAPMDAAPMDAAPMDAEPMDADPADADPIDADPADADPTDAIDDGDGGRTCATIQAEYDAIVARRGCVEMNDCRIVGGHCYVGLGGCWYAVNATVMQADLDALGNEYSALGCTTAVCDCAPSPAGAICNMGICMEP